MQSQGNVRQTQIKGHATKYLLCNPQYVRGKNIKEKMKNCSKVKETKEIWQPTAMHNSKLDALGITLLR